MEKKISLFRNHLPLEKGRGPFLNKLDFPIPKDSLCQVWLKMTYLVVLETKIFKFRPCFFRYFIIIFPWNGRDP